MLRVAKILLFCSLTSASVFHAAEPTTARGLDGAPREKLEAAGEELPGAPAPRVTTPDRARRRQALEALGDGGLLLVPESTNDRVMAFDPADGTLIDPDFIPADPDNLSTPINAVLNDEGNRVLVVDQLEDLISQYTLTGSFDGIFAPAGGPNTAVYDNPRGFENNPFSVNYLATSGNTDSIADFFGNSVTGYSFVAGERSRNEYPVTAFPSPRPAYETTLGAPVGSSR